MKPVLLHGHASSPNVIKVSITLQYLDISYEIKIWELGDDPHLGVRGEDFAKISPNSRVPVLTDPNTDVCVWESAAIINYLKRRYDPSNILGPRASSYQAQASLDQWEYLLVTTVAPMTGQLVWFRFYSSQPNKAAEARYEEQIHRYYGVVERQLEKTGGNSILPGGITSVDVHFEPWLRRPEYIQVSLDKYPYIKRWLKRLSNEKAVQDGYQRIRDTTSRQDPMAEARGLQSLP